MKVFITNALIFITAITLTFNANAQSDYVITVKGDTIYCKISSPIFGDLKYQGAAMSESKGISFYEIKEYYIAKDKILNRAVYLPEHRLPQFMTVLESGKINLYEQTINYTQVSSAPGGMSYSTSSTEWFVGKGTDTVKGLKYDDLTLTPSFKSKKSRKNDFAEMLKDNKTVYDKFNADDKFSGGEIRNLIHLYNSGLYNIVQAYEPPQKDYVITKNKGTIFCEIEPATFSTPARYKADPKDRFAKIDTTITEYFLANNSSIYVLKTLPKNKRPEVIKCLVEGRINLYAYSLNNASKDSEASLYANKGPGDLVQIKHSFKHADNDDKKAFADLISDDPGLSEKFKNLPYDFASVLDCVKMYNSAHSTNDKPTKLHRFP